MIWRIFGSKISDSNAAKATMFALQVASPKMQRGVVMMNLCSIDRSTESFMTNFTQVFLHLSRYIWDRVGDGKRHFTFTQNLETIQAN